MLGTTCATVFAAKYLTTAMSTHSPNIDQALSGGCQVRPYLIADGGDVSVAAVEGGTVMLRLEGACGTCPSSTATMKMGIERALKVRGAALFRCHVADSVSTSIGGLSQWTLDAGSGLESGLACYEGSPSGCLALTGLPCRQA